MVAAPPPGRGCPAERGLATRVADCLGSAYGTSMFTNRMPRFEPLSEEALAVIDAGVDRLAAEVGVQFDHPDALEHFRAAGQTIVDQTVHFDPGFLRAQAELAPRTFSLRAREARRSLDVGGDSMLFSAVNGPPFALRDGVRRDGTM